MSNQSKQSGSGSVTKQSLLQQVRGSMVNIEKLNEENFKAVAEKGFPFERAKEYSRERHIISSTGEGAVVVNKSAECALVCKPQRFRSGVVRWQSRPQECYQLPESHTVSAAVTE